MDSTNLITNAILAVTWEQSKKDYLDIISPFVIYSAFKSTTEENGAIDISELTSFTNEEFNLKLVDSITVCILKRQKKYFIKKGRPACFFLIKDSYDPAKFEQNRLESKQNYDYFIRSMQSYISEKLNKNFDRHRLEEKLTKFISLNFFDLLNWNSNVKYRDNELYEFISYVLSSNKILKNILSDIVKGQMIYEAIYAQNVSKADIKQKFNNLNIYFDTTFIFYLLGYGGDRYKKYIFQIIDLLKGLGAKLKCFRHTVNEIRGILENCEYAIEQGNEKKLTNLDWFIENKMTPTDINILLANLDSNISNYIEIVDTPDYSDPMTNINWERFSNYLDAKISYKKEKTLMNDVESIASIFRLRQGKISNTLESSTAIFVTTNTRLVYVVREYQKQNDDMNGFSPCISEYEISNIAWLKTPSKQAEFIDESLKFSASILKEPSPTFWKRFSETIDKFQNNGDITLENATELKYEIYSKRNTAEIIKEDDEEITLESVQKILERNKQNQHKELIDTIKKKDDKISRLKNEEIKNVKRYIKKYRVFLFVLFIAIYIIIILANIVVAICSITDLIINYTKTNIFKFVFIIQIVCTIISAFIPNLRKLFYIKRSILAIVDKKTKEKEEVYMKRINDKYDD